MPGFTLWISFLQEGGQAKLRRVSISAARLFVQYGGTVSKLCCGLWLNLRSTEAHVFVRRLIFSSLALLLMWSPAVTQTVNMNRPSDLPTTQQVLTPEALRARLQNVKF